MSGYRLAEGGRIDRSRPLSFTFDGLALSGFAGDTLASALLASGVDVVGRSVRFGRPRGIFAAGSEEPNALVSVGPAASPECSRAPRPPSSPRASKHEASPGAVRFPAAATIATSSATTTVRFSSSAAVRQASPLPFRPAASGARVVLIDEKPELGGLRLGAPDVLNGRPVTDWVAAAAAELATLPEVLVLTRTTAVARYDANLVVAVERLTDHLPPPDRNGRSRQRLWHIRARQIVVATGAFERPIVFANNDRPGVMLAGAVRTYLHRFGVAAGRRAVLFTTNDSAYPAAIDLARAGVEVPLIVDVRPARSAWGRRAADAGIECLAGRVVIDTAGDSALRSVTIGPAAATRTGSRSITTVECDVLAVSGGWNPAAALYSFPGGRLRWDSAIGSFVPAVAIPGVEVTGGAAGQIGLRACLESGAMTGTRAAYSAGFPTTVPREKYAVTDETPEPALALWMVAAPTDAADAPQFVDLQRDATVANVREAVNRGMRYPEHIKRWTTIGTGNDQGRTSAVNEVGVIATLTGQRLEELVPTAFRPPAVPVAFGLLAGAYRGDLYDPIRTTAAHASHEAMGAIFENVGQWKRAWGYPRPGEAFEDAVLRECAAVRDGVGIMDVSTLGKIDVQGRDAAVFLDRIYTNTFSTLRVGASRYGLMCRADGMVLDDGTTTRLADDHFFMTTTTGNAGPVLEWLEEWSQTEWPGLEVRFTSVTDHWSATAIVGPRSRELLARLVPDLELDAAAFPWMTFREATVGGMPARIFRISFSGELAYEVNVPSWHGRALWDAIAAAGRDLGVTPYGTEAMHVLRAEKGYFIVGQETDGTVTPLDLGLDWMVSRKKWFVGRRSLERPAMLEPDRRQLVGLLPDDPDELLPEGAPVPARQLGIAAFGTAGHVTSSYRSAALGRTFAMALLAGGRARHGSTVIVDVDGREVAARVVEPVFYDPKNERRDG